MDIDDLRGRDWLLLPGTLCTAEVFAGLLDALGIPPGRRRPLPLIHPRVADYGSALDAQAGGAVLCGFSLGAIVAAHHLDRISPARTILFGVNPHPDDPAKAEGRRALEQDVLATGGAAAMLPRLPPLGGPDPDKARATILAMAEQTAAQITAHTELALSRPGALPALSRSRAPVLVLTGTEDQMTPVALGRTAAEAAPSGRFVGLPSLGHYALLEDPVACATALLDLEAAAP